MLLLYHVGNTLLAHTKSIKDLLLFIIITINNYSDQNFDTFFKIKKGQNWAMFSLHSLCGCLALKHTKQGFKNTRT